MNRYWKTALDLDRRMREADIPYCVMKTYGAHDDFNDSNIDVVCLVPLQEVYRRAYPDYTLSVRDRIKAVLYERNKLMVKHPSRETSDIHLHSNAGWHNIEFVSGEEILANKTELPLEGGSVQILASPLDKKILTLQVMFENFKKKKWDKLVLDDGDFAAFAGEYGVTPEEIAPVQESPIDTPLRGPYLRSIWRKYYAKRSRETSITAWNRFLHELLFRLQLYRMSKLS